MTQKQVQSVGRRGCQLTFGGSSKNQLQMSNVSWVLLAKNEKQQTESGSGSISTNLIDLIKPNEKGVYYCRF